MGVRELSDAELIAGARKGDPDAYGELYRRHVDSARAAARALTRSRSDADDLTSEAFARVLRALQRGGGPEVSFRPYLVTAVRNVFYDKVRRNREEPSPDMSDEVNVALLDAAKSQEDGAFAAAAFATLPERWQLVLWHTEVEGRSVAEVAPLLGLAPNAVAALAYRAREGLRQAYLQAHLRDQQVAECRECSASLGAYVRDGLSARDRRRVDTHLDGCVSCAALVAELTDTNRTLRAALIPALIGVSAPVYLSGLGGRGVLGRLAVLPVKQQVVAGASLAASVIAIAAFTGFFGGRNESPVLSAPTSSAAQVLPAINESLSTNDSVPTPPTPPPTTPPPTTPPPTATTTPTSVVPPSTLPLPRSAVPPATVRRPPTTTPAPAPAPPTIPATIPATIPPTALPTTTSSIAPVTTPTTQPPVPSSLTVVTQQRSVALSGGQFRIQSTVTNTGAGGLNDVRLNVLAPTDATLIRAEGMMTPHAPAATFVSAAGSGWSCTGNVSCTLPVLASGESSVLQLTFAISPSAPANVSFTPTVSAPAGAAVSSSPLTVSVATVAGLLVAEIERGALVAIGNSVVTCDDLSPGCLDARAGTAIGSALDNDSHVLQYVNTAGGVFNSSSAQLSLTGTSGKSYLVWSGDVDQGGAPPSPTDFDKVKFTTPAGTTMVVADGWKNFDSEMPTNLGLYTAYADVSALVTGSGTYSVADVQTSVGVAGFGGWSLIVIDHAASLPERFMMVTAPLKLLTSTATPLSISLALPQPMVNSVGAIVTAGFEGDRSLITDEISLSGVRFTNPFRGKIVGLRDPSPSNSFGTDVFVAPTVGMNGTQFAFTADTNDDLVILPLVGLSLDL